MARNYNRRRKPMADINVVPYIDVMLVLLVIFMVTAPMFNQGVEVNLPSAPAKPIEEYMQQKEPFIVSVDQQGRVFINKISDPKKALSLLEFNQIMPGLFSQFGAQTVYVKGDAAVDYGRVVKVMATTEAAGFTSIGLITQSESE